MTSRAGLIDNRKHKRFRVKGGAFAAIKSVPEAKPVKMGQIVDISKGGLAFRYIDQKVVANEPFELDIIFARDAFQLKKILFKTVYDFDAVSEFLFTSIIIKQQGIQFRELDSSQIFQLDRFIRKYTISEV